MAARLHKDGVLKTYEEPKGRDAGWPDFGKDSHKDQSKNTTGRVYHVGDEPYSMLTTGQVQYYRELPIEMQDIKLKTASIIKAIREYMPDDAFERYLEHFTANIDKPEYKSALRKSYENIPEQFKSYRGRVSDDKFREVVASGHANMIRDAAGRSQLALESGKDPELLLTIAIYQAAQASYVKKLGEAIASHPDITADEKDNARAVISSPFRQFGTSLLFAGLVPLVRLANLDLPPEEGEGKDARMRRSIKAGWEQFFDNRVLTRTYESKDVMPETPGGKTEMTCPAINILRESCRRGSMEKIHEHVCSHRNELAQELKQVKAVAESIVTHEPQPDIKQEQAAAMPSEDTHPPASCPMRAVKKGFTAMLLGATAMLPGHDMKPQERPNHEPAPKVQRHEELPRDKRPPKFLKPKWADNVLEHKEQKKDESPDLKR